MQSPLGHADPAFTLRTYVHLLDEGLGDADFLDHVVCSDNREKSLTDATRIIAHSPGGGGSYYFVEAFENVLGAGTDLRRSSLVSSTTRVLATRATVCTAGWSDPGSRSQEI